MDWIRLVRNCAILHRRINWSLSDWFLTAAALLPCTEMTDGKTFWLICSWLKVYLNKEVQFRSKSGMKSGRLKRMDSELLILPASSCKPFWSTKALSWCFGCLLANIISDGKMSMHLIKMCSFHQRGQPWNLETGELWRSVPCMHCTAGLTVWPYALLRCSSRSIEV